MSRRFACVFAGAMIFMSIVSAAWAAGERSQTPEERRRSRLVKHLKRLNRPADWLIARKIFSSNRTRQIEGLENCPYSEIEWPWYLSSGHLERYAFTVDFIPVNMDKDPEEETLIVIQSDTDKINYATFCLVDDSKRGSTPLSSYSEISHGKPITFQLADLTGEGDNEIIVYTRDDRGGRLLDSVRIIKPNDKRHLDLVWFSHLRGEFQWPPARDEVFKGRTVVRTEVIKAKMRLGFNGKGNPATIILKGDREFKNKFTFDNGTTRRSVQKIAFEEHWRWDKKRFRFFRVPDFE